PDPGPINPPLTGGRRLAGAREAKREDPMDAMTEQELRHHTRPLSREQCYLCIMTLVDPPPKGAVPEERLKAEHKKFLVELETKGMLFGAGKLANEKRGEKTALGHGMFILRA